MAQNTDPNTIPGVARGKDLPPRVREALARGQAAQRKHTNDLAGQSEIQPGAVVVNEPLPGRNLEDTVSNGTIGAAPSVAAPVAAAPAKLPPKKEEVMPAPTNRPANAAPVVTTPAAPAKQAAPRPAASPASGAPMSGPRVYRPGQKGTSTSKTLIIGKSGSGKSSLAATWPMPLLLDFEDGQWAVAEAANAWRIGMDQDVNTLDYLKKTIAQLQASPYNATYKALEFKLEGETVLVGTVVIDPFDGIQRAYKSYNILKGRQQMETQDWGRLLEAVSPIVADFMKLPIHKVVVCHAEQFQLIKGQPVQQGLALQGKLAKQFPDWFDVIINLVVGEGGQHCAVARPMISRNVDYLAKDRGLLKPITPKNGFIPVAFDEVTGLPVSTIADAITSKGASLVGVDFSQDQGVDPFFDPNFALEESAVA